MSKRISPESRVMEYAKSADPAAAVAVLTLALAEARLRVPAVPGVTRGKVGRPAKARAAEPAPGLQTSV